MSPTTLQTCSRRGRDEIASNQVRQAHQVEPRDRRDRPVRPRLAGDQAQLTLALQVPGAPEKKSTFHRHTGVVGRGVIRTGAAAAMANGALEFFVPTAAAELPSGLRINAVSPTVLREAARYHPSFPGFVPVPAATVAQTYLRSVDGIVTGQVFRVD
jgi:hypothetical protein